MDEQTQFRKHITTLVDVFAFMAVCLLLPTILKYITGWMWVQYLIDVGIVLLTSILLFIRYRIKKKIKTLRQQ